MRVITIVAASNVMVGVQVVPTMLALPPLLFLVELPPVHRSN